MLLNDSHGNNGAQTGKKTGAPVPPVMSVADMLYPWTRFCICVLTVASVAMVRDADLSLRFPGSGFLNFLARL